MTGRNTLLTLVAGVAETIKQVWYLVVVVFAVHSTFNIFLWQVSLKCHRWRI